jgi:diguanylate cyclase (GGDEF)-like protein
MSRDITEQKLVEQQVWKNANYDLLTGLCNRLMFLEKMEWAIKHSKRSNKSFALLFIDLDKFKKINDTFGHDVGDFLLKRVAKRISSCVRDTDTVARIGGDEFTAILIDVCDVEQVIFVVEKILSELRKPFQIQKNLIHISGSIGVTISPEDGIKSIDLLRNADHSMYVAKKSGSNLFEFYKDEKF